MTKLTIWTFWWSHPRELSNEIGSSPLLIYHTYSKNIMCTFAPLACQKTFWFKRLCITTNSWPSMDVESANPPHVSSLPFLPRLMRAFTSALRIGFPSVLVTATPHVVIWHEIRNCFFVHRQQVCTCPNWVRISFQLCCPKWLHIQVPQHINWSHCSQHLNCMNMITRRLTSCSTSVDKQHKWGCKDTFALGQSFGVHHDMYARFVVPVQVYYKCTKEYLWKKLHSFHIWCT